MVILLMGAGLELWMHDAGVVRRAGCMFLHWLKSLASKSLANPLVEDRDFGLLALTTALTGSRRPPTKQLTCRDCSIGPAFPNSFSNLSWWSCT